MSVGCRLVFGVGLGVVVVHGVLVGFDVVSGWVLRPVVRVHVAWDGVWRVCEACGCWRWRGRAFVSGDVQQAVCVHGGGVSVFSDLVR